MPNWCENRMTINAASNADLLSLKQKLAFVRSGELQGQNSFMDDYGSTIPTWKVRFIFAFSSFLPMPEDVEDWYAWSLANWGTKWDVDIADGRDSGYGDAGQFTISDDGKSMELFYHTACSPPLQAMRELSKLDLVESVELCYHEGGCGFVGRAVYEHGEEVDSMYSQSIYDLKKYSHEWFGYGYEDYDGDEEDVDEDADTSKSDMDEDIDWDEWPSVDRSRLLKTPPPPPTDDDDKF